MLDVTGGGDHLYRHRDYRGNVQYTSDALGNILTSYHYAAYGLHATSGGLEDREQRFARGADFGDVMLIGARLYDTKSGRFLSQDPFFNAINQYSYTLGNPIEFGDPSGAIGDFNLTDILKYILEVLRNDIAGLLIGLAQKPLGIFEGINEAIEKFWQGDAIGGLTGIGKAIWSAVVPTYGFYGGAGVGTEQYGADGTPAPLNRVDEASLQHDVNFRHHQWISSAIFGDGLAPGPFGIAYTAVGAVGFGVAGVFQ